jgi:metaxin
MTSTVEPPQSNRWFAVPRPIQYLFNHFPLHVYGPEDLPVRSPASVRQRPALYVFVADEDAVLGRPSYNPSCLKWQVCFDFLLGRGEVSCAKTNAKLGRQC